MVMAGEVVVGLNARAGTFVREFAKASKTITVWKTSARKATKDTAAVTKRINTLRISAQWLKPALEDIAAASNRVKASMQSFEKAAGKLQARKQALRASSTGLLKSLIPLAAGYASLRLASVGFNLAEQAASYADASKSFEKAGGNIEVLREATSGLIDDAQLVRRANLARIMKIPADAFAKLANVAKASSAQTGQSFSFLLNSIITGTARQSRLILDNLGILINAGEANKKYAESHGLVADAMTDAQKRAAFLAEVLAQGQKIIESAGDGAVSSTEAFQRFRAQVANLALAIGEKLGPAIRTALKFWGEFADTMIKIIKNAPNLTSTIEDIAKSLFQSGAQPRKSAAEELQDELGTRVFLLRQAIDEETKLRGELNASVAARRDITGQGRTADEIKQAIAVQVAGIKDLKKQIADLKGIKPAVVLKPEVKPEISEEEKKKLADALAKKIAEAIKKAIALAAKSREKLLGSTGQGQVRLIGESLTKDLKTAGAGLKGDALDEAQASLTENAKAQTVEVIKSTKGFADFTRAILEAKKGLFALDPSRLKDVTGGVDPGRAGGLGLSGLGRVRPGSAGGLTVEDFERRNAKKKEEEKKIEEAAQAAGELFGNSVVSVFSGDLVPLGKMLGANIGETIGGVLGGAAGVAAGGIIGGEIGGEVVSAVIEVAKFIGETFVQGIKDVGGSIKEGLIDPVVGTSSGAGQIVGAAQGAAETGMKFAGGAFAVALTGPIVALVAALGVFSFVAVTLISIVQHLVVAFIVFLSPLNIITLAVSATAAALLAFVAVATLGITAFAATLALGSKSEQADRFGAVLDVASDKIQNTAGNIFTSLMPIAGLFVALANAIAPILNRFTGVQDAVPVIFNAIKFIAIALLTAALTISIAFETTATVLINTAIHLLRLQKVLGSVNVGILRFGEALQRAIGNTDAADDLRDQAIESVGDLGAINQQIDDLQDTVVSLDTTTGKIQDALDEVDALEVGVGLDAIDDLGDEVDDATSSFQAMNESLSRVPRGVRVALQRFEASRAQGSVAEFGSVNAAGPIAGGAAGIIINIGQINQDEDPELVLNKVISGTQRRFTQNTGNPNVEALDANGF